MASAKVQEAIDIVDGMSDEELNRFVDYIRVELKQRARRRSQKALAALEVGSKVQWVTKTRPQYLQGMTGVVTKMRDSRVEVTLDHGPVGKFRSGIVIAQPAGLKVLD